MGPFYSNPHLELLYPEAQVAPVDWHGGLRGRSRAAPGEGALRDVSGAKACLVGGSAGGYLWWLAGDFQGSAENATSHLARTTHSGQIIVDSRGWLNRGRRHGLPTFSAPM
jgi:hypothetical protein